MANRNEEWNIELSINSISWNLKRIADSLEAIEDSLTGPKPPRNSVGIKELLAGLKSKDNSDE